MKISIARISLTLLLGALLSFQASAQTGLELDPSVVTLEPGDNFPAASIGSIQGFATGVYFLFFEQAGTLQLQNLQMFVNGLAIASGGQLFFSGSSQLGMSFFIAANATEGQSAVVTVRLRNVLGQVVGSDSFRVEIRLEPGFRLACFRTHDGVHHLVSEGDLDSVNADRPWCLAFEVHQVIDLDGDELQDGDAVAILAWHGRYWSGQPNGGLQANRQARREWERFELRKVDGSAGPTLRRGDRFALRTFHDLWVVAEQAGGSIAQANRPVQSIWETLTFLPGTRQSICLQSHDGQFVGSGGNPGRVDATADSCAGPAVHELIDIDAGELLSGEVVYLRSRDDRYWSAQPNGDLTADRPNAGLWERFRLVKRFGSPGEAIVEGDEVALQSFHDRWVVAEGGGGFEVAADREVASIWETFLFQLR